jgi:hypothetical protein
MPKTESKQQLGVRGEDLACAKLERQGMDAGVADPDGTAPPCHGYHPSVALDLYAGIPVSDYPGAVAC